MVNSKRNASAYSIGVSRWIEPLYIVAIQLKTLMAGGMAIRNVRTLKIVPASTRLAADEHVVAPDEEAQERDRDAARAR